MPRCLPRSPFTSHGISHCSSDGSSLYESESSHRSPVVWPFIGFRLTVRKGGDEILVYWLAFVGPGHCCPCQIRKAQLGSDVNMASPSLLGSTSGWRHSGRVTSPCLSVAGISASHWQRKSLSHVSWPEFFLFFWYRELNSGPCAYQAGA